MAKAGNAGGREPVKTGAHRDIERQLGAPTLRKPDEVGDDELDELPPGWKSRYQEHQEAQEHEQALRSASTSPSNRPAAKRGGDRVRRSAGARRPASGRRHGRPSFGDPTGGRLPITFDSEGLGGLFIGAVVYALLLSVVEYGSAGPGLWFKAKFLNQAAGAPSSTKPAAASGGSTGVRLA